MLVAMQWGKEQESVSNHLEDADLLEPQMVIKSGTCGGEPGHGPEVQNVGDLLQSLPLQDSDTEQVVYVAVTGLRLRMEVDLLLSLSPLQGSDSE